MHNLIPYGQISQSHPLLKLESRRARKLLTPRQLVHRGLKILSIVFVTLLVLWYIAIVDNNQRFYGSALGDFLSNLFLISIGLDGVLDFACMIVTANGFAREIAAGRWNLLRLTPYTAEDFAAVKYIVARLRVWRMTLVVFAVRFTFILLAVFTVLHNNGLFYFRFRLDSAPVFMAFVSIVAVYLIEPFWRAKVVTLLGLTISVRLRNGVSLGMAAVGLILSLWILQSFMIGLLYVFTMLIIDSHRILLGIKASSIDNISLTILCVYIVAVLYGTYSILRKNTYQRLILWINRSEG